MSFSSSQGSYYALNTNYIYPIPAPLIGSVGSVAVVNYIDVASGTETEVANVILPAGVYSVNASIHMAIGAGATYFTTAHCDILSDAVVLNISNLTFMQDCLTACNAPVLTYFVSDGVKHLIVRVNGTLNAGAYSITGATSHINYCRLA